MPRYLYVINRPADILLASAVGVGTLFIRERDIPPKPGHSLIELLTWRYSRAQSPGDWIRSRVGITSTGSKEEVEEESLEAATTWLANTTEAKEDQERMEEKL
ncbi:MAG: hypothetical protein DHS80DRAFT_32512 [Piptocephalis tieghemiana]|nr:MAG: hypothetical protein DHS80DRAFT_32512 [Piptocephalis tieghemiana]